MPRSTKESRELQAHRKRNERMFSMLPKVQYGIALGMTDQQLMEGLGLTAKDLAAIKRFKQSK